MAYLPNNSIVSTANSTTSPLAAAGVFTGVSEDISQYASVTVLVFADQASATDGLSIQQSPNGTNWDSADVYTVPITTAGNAKTFGVQVSGQFFRVVYTNGVTAQSTFRLQTQYHAVAIPTSSVRPQDGRSNENDMEEVLAYNMLWNGTSWDRALKGPQLSAQSQSVVIANDQIPIMTNAAGLNATNSVSVLNGDLLASTDVTNYRSFSFQVTGTFSGTYTFQGSNDNFATTASTFNIQAIQANSNGGIVTSSTTTNIVWKGPINTRYIRIRMTSYTSGTAVGVTNISAQPLDSFYQFSSVTGTVTATPPNATANGSITASGQTLSLGTNLIGGGGYATIQIFGTHAGVSFTLQSSGNNGTNMFNVPIYDTNAGIWLKPGSVVTPGANAINAYYVPITPYANQTKLVSTAYTSGTMSVLYLASTNGQPGSVMTQEYTPSTPTVTAVASSATAVTLLAANNNRRQAMVYNASTAILYLRYGGTATTAFGGFTTAVPASAYYELPYPACTAALSGIWATANGGASVTEIV